MKKHIKKTNLLALLSTFSVLTGCGNNVGDLEEVFEDDGEPYEIVYYMPYVDANIPSQDAILNIQTKLSALTRKKINASVKLEVFTFQNYGTQVGKKIMDGSEFDVCFTSPATNSYYAGVEEEAFLPLDYLLPTYAPETWNAYDSKIWDQARVGGKIYGSINEQIFPRSLALDAKSGNQILMSYLGREGSGYVDDQGNPCKPGEVADYFGKTGCASNAFEFIEQYLVWLAQNDKGYKGKISTSSSYAPVMTALFGFDDLCTGVYTPGCVRAGDTSGTVVNQFETDEFKQYINTMKHYRDIGLIDDGASHFDLTFDDTWKPGYKSDTLIKGSQPHYISSYIIGSMNAISSTSKNPARAMKFINLLRTDKEIHNLIQFGVEDVNYRLDPNNPNRVAKFITGSDYDNKDYGWGLGTEFISYLYGDQEDDLWEQVKEINKNTPLTDVMGFNFDQSSVSIEITNCQAVLNEYLNGFAKASFSNVESKYNEMISRLKTAGCDTIVQEKQKQLNAYLASKK